MSTPNPYPPQQPPTPVGFVPPGGGGGGGGSYPGQVPPRRSGGGCWLYGGLGCLAVLLIFAALTAIGLHKLAKSGIGQNIFRGAQNMADCTQKMRQVHDAILRYHEHTGKYPAALTALAPIYIDSSALHCSLDPNPSPTHPTFAYKQPPAATPETAAVPVLSFHWKLSIPIGGQTAQSTDTEYVMLLNGSVKQTQSQSTTSSSSGSAQTSRTVHTIELAPGT